MTKKPAPITCGKLMHKDEAQRLAKWKWIRCELPPGHEGNHQGRNKFARFEWWNEEKNPQRSVT